MVESAGTKQWPDSQSDMNAAAMVAGEQAKKIVVRTTESSPRNQNDDNVERTWEHQRRETYTTKIGRHEAIGWMKIDSAAVGPTLGEISSGERTRLYGTQYREEGVKRGFESRLQYEQEDTELEGHAVWLKHHAARRHEYTNISDEVRERESTPSPLPSPPSPAECLIRGTRARVSNSVRTHASRAMTGSVTPCRIDWMLPSLLGSTKQDVDSTTMDGQPFEGIDSARDARPRQESSLNIGASDTQLRSLGRAASHSNSDEFGGGACPLNVGQRHSCAPTRPPLIRYDAEEKTRPHTATNAHCKSEETAVGVSQCGGFDCGHDHAEAPWSQGLALDLAGQSTEGAMKLSFRPGHGVDAENRDTSTAQVTATGRGSPLESGTNAMPTVPAPSSSPFTEEVIVRGNRGNGATVDANPSGVHQRDVNTRSESKLSVLGATSIVEQREMAAHILRRWLTEVALNIHARKKNVQETEKRAGEMDERHSEPSGHTLNMPLGGLIAGVVDTITNDSGTASFEGRHWSKRVGASIVVGADVCTSRTPAPSKETPNVPFASACVQNCSAPSRCRLFDTRLGPKQEHTLQSKKAVACSHSAYHSENSKRRGCAAAGQKYATGEKTIKDERKRLRTVNEHSVAVGTGITAEPNPSSVSCTCGVKACTASKGVSASLGLKTSNATPKESGIRQLFPQQAGMRQPSASTSECCSRGDVMSSVSSSRISASAVAGVAASLHANGLVVGPRRHERVAVEPQVQKTIGNPGQPDKRRISWGTSEMFPSSPVSSNLSPTLLMEVATTTGSSEAPQTQVGEEIPPILIVNEATCNSSTSGWGERAALIHTDSFRSAGRADGRVNSRNTTQAVTMLPIPTLDDKEVGSHQSPAGGGFIGLSDHAAILPRSTAPAVLVSMEQKAEKGASNRISTFEAQQPVSSVASSNGIHGAKCILRSRDMGVADGRPTDDDPLNLRSPPPPSSIKETCATCDEAGHDGPFIGDSAFNKMIGEGKAASSRRPVTLVHGLMAASSKSPNIDLPKARYEEPGVVAKNASSYRSDAQGSSAVFPAYVPRQDETELALLAKCRGTTASWGPRSVGNSFNNPLLETFGVDNPLLAPSSAESRDFVKDYFQKSSAAWFG